MARRRFGVERAVRALHEETARALRERGGRLRSIRTMAAAADVSPVTMWKAVRELRRDGALRVRPRGTITAVAGPALSAPAGRPAPSGPVWESVAARISDDLLRQVYEPGEFLPPVKQIASHYGVCPATVRRAAGLLTRRRVLERAGRRLRAPGLPRLLRPSAIALVALGDTPQTVAVLSERTQMMLQFLESDCARLGLSLLPLVYSYDDHELHMAGQRSGLRPVRRDEVLGTMFWMTGLSAETVAEILRGLVRIGKPVAILDEGKEWPYPAVADATGCLRAFAVAGSVVAGENMGRFLLRLGHRRVAFLSSVHGNRWSQNRCAGLRNAWRAAGLDGAMVTEYTAGLRSASEAGPAGADPSGEILRAFRSGSMKALVSRPMFARAVSSLSLVLGRQAVQEFLRDVLEPLVDAALAAQPPATAWVASNDSDAIFCLDLLAQRGVSVPEQVSLAGFDDIVDAFTRRLTSYDFNIPAYLHAMIGHIVHRTRSARVPRYPQATEIEGFVIPRATTAAAGQEGQKGRAEIQNPKSKTQMVEEGLFA